jgi:hypothetical protein
MRKHLSILFVLFAIKSNGQKNIDIGQGILFIDYTKMEALTFYEDTSDLNPVMAVSFYRDQHGEFQIKNASNVRSWFNPEGLWIDYDIFIMRVDTSIGGWYRVYVNNDKGTMLWTKANSIKKFEPWDTFLLNETTSISKLPGFDLDIKQSPAKDGETIKKIEDADCFEVIEINGEWIKVKTNETLECSQSEKPVKSGWIKWRHDNKLTISYGLTC